MNDVILEEINVKAIEFIDESSPIVRKTATANFKIIGGFHCVRVTNLGPTGTVRIRVDGGPWTAKVDVNDVAESCHH